VRGINHNYWASHTTSKLWLEHRIVIYKLISICFSGLIIGWSWVIKAALLHSYITRELSSIYKNIHQTRVILQMIERKKGDSQNKIVTKTRFKLHIIPDYAGIQYGFVGTNATVYPYTHDEIKRVRCHEKRLLASSYSSASTYHRGSHWTVSVKFDNETSMKICRKK
jgi:hypothetical protein